MELRHLHYFIAVAEELHFGNAAKRLHMSQPPLSQQVRQLEEELGVSLFSRTSRSVALTPEGAAFLEDARDILQRTELAVKRVQAVANGEEGLLRVGFMGYALMTGYPQAIREFRQRYPKVRLELWEFSTAHQLRMIAADELDVGLISCVRGVPMKLDSLLFRKEPFMLCIPEGHPLAELEAVPLARLAGVPLILFPRKAHPMLYDALIASFRNAGVVAEVVQSVARIETGKALVAAGLGCSIHPASVSAAMRPGVVYRPLIGDMPSPELRVVWKKDNLSAALSLFLEEVRLYRDEV
ncbi:LysR substrate-binding domain-containing protein [Desulfovibrio mangrovi]|uniref:LysR substrate-binding domain-containing protein n=1 Tax=Desulfovibrio mangrovi TaxID=2976983 RepID=UPI0022456165|nr:LysR substrate-binding domain-containing protein [Desulfovibrio mangrovi]UZP67355.1 LysR substrate-binding domain-containing protein [Desulfovibrio mangrovi]